MPCSYSATRIPAARCLPKAAFWLVNHRDGGFYWDSTEETAMVIFGLTEYVKTSHELDANFKADIFVNGKQVFTKQFTSADSFNPVQPSIHLNTADLKPGVNQIVVHKSGTGRLYWSANGSYYSADKRLVQSNGLSLNITRDYFRMTLQSVNGKIVYHLDPLTGDLHVGDLVAVRVTIGGGEWRYLLVEDPIPAGAEFVTRDDLYAFDQQPPWWQTFFERREFHDDHAAFFETYFNNTRVYTYLLKIVNPGKVPRESRDGHAHVSVRRLRHHRCRHRGGAAVSRFSLIRPAYSAAFRSGWIWLIQFLGNIALAILFTLWLWIPEAHCVANCRQL